MKRIIGVKEAAQIVEKGLTQISQLLTGLRQGVSGFKTVRGATGLQHFLSIFIMLMLSGLVSGVFLSQLPLSVRAATHAQKDYDTVEADDVEEDGNEANEAVETEVLPGQTGISADAARAAAEAASPGTKALEVELENKDGRLVYEVELDNGLEVIVDAANGNILGTEGEEVD